MDKRVVEESIQHVLDCLVSDDIAVVNSPLMLGRVNDPVWQRVRECVRDEGWDPPEHGLDAPLEELARALRVPTDLLERYPMVGAAGVIARVCDDLGVSREDVATQTLISDVFDSWCDAFGDRAPRPFRLTPAGRENDFEDWLEGNLDLLSEVLGYGVRLAHGEDGLPGRQPVLHPDSRADLVCRVSDSWERADPRPGDWLVIENKVSPVGQPAYWQLARYVDHLRSKVPEPVHGLLIADGASVNLERALRERGFGYLSLAELGYRDVIRERRTQWDPDHTSVLVDGSRTDLTGA